MSDVILEFTYNERGMLAECRELGDGANRQRSTIYPTLHDRFLAADPPIEATDSAPDLEP